MRRWASAAVLAWALAASVQAQERPWTPLPDPVSATCPGGLCQPEGLAEFFHTLNQPPGTIRIVQFGDSHTAGGRITGALEQRLRNRFADRPVTVFAHGRVGATLQALETHEPLFADAEAAPDLVILAYGANDGFDDLLDPRAFERRLRTQIQRIRDVSPITSILILGAPDAMRGEGGGMCADDAEGRWRAPAMLGVVRDVQHRVAADMDVAFWDWKGRMGGDCAAHRLSLGPEPLVRGDHVHFTQAGGEWIGGLLFDDLMSARNRAGR